MPPDDAAPSLSQRLRARTQASHRAVEQTAFMRALLAGRLSASAYGTLLTNLLTLYRALEAHLSHHADRAEVTAVFDERLRRVPALERDLEVFGGGEVVSEARAYVAHLDTLARMSPHRLVAHAYVRYLGDLSGGQLLDGIVKRSIEGAEEAGRSFYDFGGPDAVRELASRMRSGLDRIDVALHDDIVDEAVAAFVRHEALFDAVEDQRSRSDRMRS